MIAEYLGGVYRPRIMIDQQDAEVPSERTDEVRMREMKKVNPKFIPRAWVLQELVERVEQKGERAVLKGVLEMVIRPFEESWGWDEELEERWCGDPPRRERGLQCSCSS